MPGRKKKTIECVLKWKAKWLLKKNYNFIDLKKLLSLLVDSLFVLLLSLIGGGSAGFGDVVSSMAFDVAVSDDDGVGDAFLSAVFCASGCFVLLFGTLAFDLGTMVTNIAVVIVVVDVGHFG